MSLTFNNVTYQETFWAILSAFDGSNATVGTMNPGVTMTFNGTISAALDPLAWVDNNSGSGTFLATNFDSAGFILLTHNLNTSIRFILSNTPLTTGQVVNFGETNFGDYQVPCFAAGTRVMTLAGEVAVEDLEVGDTVMLADGGTAPVRWIGRREVECAVLRDGPKFWPLRIRQGAFGPGQPHRDLLLSPDHAVFFNGTLIPVRYLENGTSIARAPMAEVTYFHIELDRHAVLLAEGLECESYLDTGNRDDFVGLRRNPAQAQASERAARAVWSSQACHPLHVAGPVVAAARLLLAKRATASGLAPRDDWGMRLRVGGVDHAPVWDGPDILFELDEAAEDAWLVSDAFVPAVVFPHLSDRRSLGVPVARVEIDGVALTLDDVRLLRRGWHAPEADLRWTTGLAALPKLRQLRIVLAEVSLEQARQAAA